jgi:hypothetical protein
LNTWINPCMETCLALQVSAAFFPSGAFSSI